MFVTMDNHRLYALFDFLYEICPEVERGQSSFGSPTACFTVYSPPLRYDND